MKRKQKEKNTALRIIGNSLLFIVLLGGFSIFALPLMYPSLKETKDEDQHIIQTIYKEFDSEALITDAETTWSMVDDTELEISINEDSEILVSFTGVGGFGMEDTFTGFMEVLISVVVEDAGNRTIRIRHHEPDGLLSYKNVYFPFTIEYMTKELSEGTYNVQVYWRFLSNPTGTNQFFFKTSGMTQYYHKRSLLVQELA